MWISPKYWGNQKNYQYYWIFFFSYNKAIPVWDIHTNMLKQTTVIHLPITTQIINKSNDNDWYHDDLKFPEVSTVLKSSMI